METTSRKYLTFADKVKLLKKFETSTVSKKEFVRNEGIPFSSVVARYGEEQFYFQEKKTGGVTWRTRGGSLSLGGKKK